MVNPDGKSVWLESFVSVCQIVLLPDVANINVGLAVSPWYAKIWSPLEEIFKSFPSGAKSVVPPTLYF